jgi:hypothetical protein
MRKNSSIRKYNGPIPASPPKRLNRAALLWDESFLWGVMSYRALRAAGLPFDLVRAEDISRGGLEQYALLFVPGGWSSNKMKALGDEGAEAVRSFVSSGGNYLGFCGGAGLATDDGIGLLAVRRKATKERVPSFSGRVRLRTTRHPVWNSAAASPIYYAWWPPQFGMLGKNIRALAKYDKALPDSFSSDLNTGDISASGSWKDMEQLYQINLDPARLIGESAVIEGRFGEGKVILSLVHFDTPDDNNGPTVLKNIWGYLISGCRFPSRPGPGAGNAAAGYQGTGASTAEFTIAAELESAAYDLISLGIRNFLWFWRNPLLLQWRRGVRGLEYCTLYIMIKEIAGLLENRNGCNMEKSLKDLKKELLSFLLKAKDLLIRERIAMQQGHITYDQCNDMAIRKLREDLFASSKSYGGRFKELLDNIDRTLYLLLKEEDSHIPAVRHSRRTY